MLVILLCKNRNFVLKLPVNSSFLCKTNLKGWSVMLLPDVSNRRQEQKRECEGKEQNILNSVFYVFTCLLNIPKADYKLCTSERRKQDKHTQTKTKTRHLVVLLTKLTKCRTQPYVCITFNALLSYPSGRAV